MIDGDNYFATNYKNCKKIIAYRKYYRYFKDIVSGQIYSGVHGRKNRKRNEVRRSCDAAGI